jgi:hypothetical protein
VAEPVDRDALREHMPDEYAETRVPPPSRLFVDALGYVWQDGPEPGTLSMARTTTRNLSSPGLIEYRAVEQNS